MSPSNPLAREVIATFIVNTQPFDLLTEAERQRLAQSITAVELCPGDILFRAGDVPDAMYIVHEGMVAPELALSQAVGPSGLIGEVSVFAAEPEHAKRHATVKALGRTNTVVLKIPFTALMEFQSRLALGFLRLLQDYVRRALLEGAVSRQARPGEIEIDLSGIEIDQ